MAAPDSTVQPNLKKTAAGQLGGRAHWADGARRRIVRLDDLTPDQRRLIVALVDAAKADVAHGDQIDEREAWLARGAQALADRQAQREPAASEVPAGSATEGTHDAEPSA
jgi:hypothetical protein